MKIALSAYLPRWHMDWAALAARLDAEVAEAAGQGADLLVFPEYAGLESVLIGQPDGAPAARDWRDRAAAAEPGWRDLCRDLAMRHRVHLLAGTTCATTPDGVVNRAWLCGPDGSTACQDKMILTPYERTAMDLVPGTDLRLFQTALGRIGVLICYDSEFPLLARALAEAGADLILVPSATDLQAGYTRVSQSCRARAIENQCLIVQSPVLGPVPGCEILEEGTGAAGAFCPPDLGLPQDGILALGRTDRPGWTLVTADPAAIAAPRHSGQVGNFAHWPEQAARVNSVTTLSV